MMPMHGVASEFVHLVGATQGEQDKIVTRGDLTRTASGGFLQLSTDTVHRSFVRW
jgi:hypothetical protein